MKKFFIILLVLTANIVFAQRTVTGLITDKSSKPIAGVKVSVKNTDVKTFTDASGTYSIAVSEGSKTLEFSKISFKVQVVDITGDVINLTMTSMSDVDIFELSLEELMNVEVTTVSKKSESLMDVATSIYVITDEDIARSGATRLQDVLNMVPGVFIGEISYNFSTVGLRNEANSFSQTILTMIDGIPLNSSISNALQLYEIDLALPHIERIEVIKGPGGTIYGANANTGVINIITKKASDNTGWHVDLNSAEPLTVSTYLSYGRKLGDKTSISMYGNYKKSDGYDKNPDFEGENLLIANGAKNGADTTIKNNYTGKDNNRSIITAGFTINSSISDKLTSSTKVHFTNIQSAYYTHTILQPKPWIFDGKKTGINCIERIDYKFSEKHNLFANMKYYYNNNLNAYSGGYHTTTNLLDFEIQDIYEFAKNELIYGANFRIVNYDINNKMEQLVNYKDPQTTQYLYAVFLQDKFKINSKLDLTIGCKVETWTLVSNSPELSPSIRLTFKPNENLTFWGAFSHTITTPGYLQTKLEFVQAIALPGSAYTTPEQATALADKQGLTGTARSTFLGKMTAYRSLFKSGTEGNPIYVAILGDDDSKASTLNTYEFGCRFKLFNKIFFDISGFYAEQYNGVGLDMDFASKPTVKSEVFGVNSIMPIYYTNLSKAQSYGGEIVAKTSLTTNIRLESSYSYFNKDNYGLPIPGNTTGKTYDIASKVVSPNHIVRLKSYIDFPKQQIYLTTYVAWMSK